MEKGKKLKKCLRGQKLCKNEKCQNPIPIHTHVCKKCGFINEMKKKTGSEDQSIIEQVFADEFKIEKVNRKTFLKIRDQFLKRIFEVSFYSLY
jgi:hypothetical protein